MSKPVVLLDPGHGGYDPGASYNGLREKDLNLMLALKVAECLNGIKVLLTREKDIYLSLTDRVALSRRAEPDLFVSLHANADGVARGVQAALGVPPDGTAAGGMKDGGIAPDTTLYTVQVGAFAYIENARQRLTEAQRAGFSNAYIYQKQF